MIDYDSFSCCHLTEIFFAIYAGAKKLSWELAKVNWIVASVSGYSLVKPHDGFDVVSLESTLRRPGVLVRNT